jgi:cytochrome P450
MMSYPPDTKVHLEAHVSRDIPTKRHRHMKQMVYKVEGLLHEILDGRREAVRKGVASSYGNDLLGHMLTAASDGWDEDAVEFNLASVIEESKLFYFAGQDTVANVTLFTLLMLALHPEWQDRARKEVVEILGDEENFDASVLSRLKVVNLLHSLISLSCRTNVLLSYVFKVFWSNHIYLLCLWIFS